MRIFLTVLTLIIGLQSWTKADDIRDFQIEGISIGDSLLNYHSKEIIKGYTRDDIKGMFSIASIPSSDFKGSLSEKKYEDYDSIDFYFKTTDKKFKIQAIGAIIFFPNKLKKCKIKKNEIVKSLEDAMDIKFLTGKLPHQLDKSGKSIQYQSVKLYKNRSNIRVECYYWTKKMQKKYSVKNLLQVSLISSEVQKWVDGGYK
tara:strand:- start:704 stop:1306 length:603 start_codon:yes stop_codon:yes gene_type:complete